MAKIYKCIAKLSSISALLISTAFMGNSTFANEIVIDLNASEQAPKFKQYQVDAAECLAFYRYGYTSNKRNNHTTALANKFNSFRKFLKKELKNDIGKNDIDEVTVIGKANFKAHMQKNDDKYAIKVDEYDRELLDLYKHYSPQCEAIIKYYQINQ